MRDLERREILKILSKSLIGVSLLPLVSCTNESTPFMPELSPSDKTGAIKSLDNYCLYSMEGGKLKSHGLNKASLPFNVKISPNGWDQLYIINGFEVIGIVENRRRTLIQVKYNLMGKIEGEIIIPYQSLHKTILKYEIIISGNTVEILDNYPPFCSTESTLLHCKSMLENEEYFPMSKNMKLELDILFDKRIEKAKKFKNNEKLIKKLTEMKEVSLTGKKRKEAFNRRRKNLLTIVNTLQSM